ncbi:MAG: FAD-dependent oxidoreductase [Candidatus Poribacteria bacterium]
MKYVTEPEKRIPVVAEVDVAVIGGGPGGLPAAIAAARNKANTLLVERYGFLGGMATNGLIGPILAHTAHQSSTPIIGGIAKELCMRMHEQGGAPEWEDALKQWGVSFDSETFKHVADQMVEEAGVRVLFHSYFSDAIVEDNEIKSIIVENKSGRQAIAARIVIDATGDADVAYRSGAPTRKGRAADGMPQSMGTIFRIGGIAKVSPEERREAAEKIRKAIDAGELKMYNTSLGGRNSTITEGEVTPNCTRFAGDATNVEDLTEGEIQVRKDTLKIVDFLRKNVPAYRNCYLIATPAQIGIRESRQIIGEATLTADDIINGRKYEDGIARGSWWIDIHCPRGFVKNEVHLCYSKCPMKDCYMHTEYAGQLVDNLYPPTGDWYDIRYGCLVPKKINNLLVSGRCISATHAAMAGARVMGTCMAIGQAAGTAGAQAVAAKTLPRELDVAKLRQTIIADGGIL